MPWASIQNARVADDALIVDLSDGRVISVPLIWFPCLVHAVTKGRANRRLIGKGEGVHWPDLDEDISAENIILGRPSGESQLSLRRWLEERSR